MLEGVAVVAGAQLLGGVKLACKWMVQAAAPEVVSFMGHAAVPEAESCISPSEEGTFIRCLRNTVGGSSQRYSLRIARSS